MRLEFFSVDSSIPRCFPLYCVFFFVNYNYLEPANVNFAFWHNHCSDPLTYKEQTVFHLCFQNNQCLFSLVY